MIIGGGAKGDEIEDGTEGGVKFFIASELLGCLTGFSLDLDGLKIADIMPVILELFVDSFCFGGFNFCISGGGGGGGGGDFGVGSDIIFF